MLAAAGVLGTIGLIVKIGTTAAIARENRRADPQPANVLMNGALFYDTFIGAGLGLAAGGMAARGKLDAHREMFEGEPATRRPRMGLGWGLFGGGLGVWALTRIIGSGACADQVCTVRVWEAGYYVSLAGTVPGSILGGYASGVRRYHKRFGHLAGVSVAPLAHRDAWGLGISGRF